MFIKKVTYGLMGAAFMSGIFSSCTHNKYQDDAKAEAVKYLNGYDLLKAERFAEQQHNADTYNGEAIAYWDSLLIEAKSKEAYAKGQQYIQDSINNKFIRKEKFKANLDTILTSNIINDVKNEYAKYTTAEELINARNNAPDNVSNPYYNDNIGTTHYWNLITIAGKQNKAYQKGMADERAKQKIPAINTVKSTVKQNAINTNK